MLADGAMVARGRVYGGGPPTALGRTLILSYYKGKVHFPTLPKCKTYADALCSMGWAAAHLLLWQGGRILAAYFCHLEGTLPVGGEFVEPYSV